jgi:outer membrane protein
LAATAISLRRRARQERCQDTGISMLARSLTGALILLSAGCTLPHADAPTAALSQRILPPPDVPAAQSQTQPASAAVETLPSPRTVAPAQTPAAPPAVAGDQSAPTAPRAPRNDCSSLTLEQAIELAMRANPNLEAMRERIDQAEGGQIVSFSDFLPDSRILYRHIEGEPNSEPFALPTLPTNLAGNVAYGGQSDRFDLTELHVQWTLSDFGRRLGKYGQAGLAVDIARLQFRRAQQSVAFSVASQYFAVLQAEASARVAEEAVRRAEVDLRDARNFLRRGTGIRNDVLRAEVLLAEMRVSLIKARTARSVALAGLNQAIGINVSSATDIVDRPAAPPFSLPLEGCLQLAVTNRDEFRIVVDAIRSARLGVGVAKADFMPRVLVGGVGAHEETAPDGHANLVAGGLSVELVLFEGGKRLGRVRIAEAEARGAVAEGKEVCDRISYEVNVAFAAIADARERIVQSQIAVTAATENLRVVRGQLEHGDASPTDVVDAELALTRAAQNYYTALYDYQIALARLAYAAGLPVLSDLTLHAEGPSHE